MSESIRDEITRVLTWSLEDVLANRHEIPGYSDDVSQVLLGIPRPTTKEDERIIDDYMRNHQYKIRVVIEWGY